MDYRTRVLFIFCSLVDFVLIDRTKVRSYLFRIIYAGKRPRDLLNPKAVKYMQSVFALKDTISKKETREISSLFRITATQVLLGPELY